MATTCPITPATIIRTDYDTDVQPDYNSAPASAYPYSYYTGDQLGYNTATPNGAPVADPTVQATQERLAKLGYYNGPVDGIFGPTTRDAVATYQIDNQLDVTVESFAGHAAVTRSAPGPDNSSCRSLFCFLDSAWITGETLRVAGGLR